MRNGLTKLVSLRRSFLFSVQNTLSCLCFSWKIQNTGEYETPVEPEAIFNVVALDDVALMAASILANPAKHKAKEYTIVSDNVSTASERVGGCMDG